MDAAELIRRVRRVELRARRATRFFCREYHSAFKGRGMAFSENRAYQHGDEIRTIDWNVTARMRSPYVKVFQEERELTAMLLIDVGAPPAASEVAERPNGNWRPNWPPSWRSPPDRTTTRSAHCCSATALSGSSHRRRAEATSTADYPRSH